MPFQSQAQRGFMFAKHPEIAKRFAVETPKGAKLPYHKSSGGKFGKLQEALSKRKKHG
jgi:hypothetical protein